MFGFFPYHASYGVFSFRVAVYALFRRYAACVTANSHRNSGMFWPHIMAHANSTRVLFALSATPFCSGVYGAVFCMSIPCSQHQDLRGSFINSLP
jgi:hypothetical protein